MPIIYPCIEVNRHADVQACEGAGAASAASAAGAASAGANAAEAATGTVNVQSFTGALGGPAPAVISSAAERPFAVNGATFLNIGAAIQRSCAIQNNACSNAANSGQNIAGGVGACNAQEDACLAAANLKVKARQATGTVNVQSFTGALGGPAPAVISSAAERPFAVNGATFLNIGAAIQRSCAVQNNACSNAANSGQNIAGGVGACNAQEDACLAAANLKMLRSRKITKVRQVGALDFGDCSDPSIIFANGLDGRKEPSFAPANAGDFSHGSALNIKVISGFICSQLASSCKADDATVAVCEQAAAAADGLKAQAAADAFNSALGL
jgi:hypothetical protein